VLVTLSVEEAITAAINGLRRQIFALSRGLEDDSEDDHAFGSHIYGAIAEFALARRLNRFWAPNIGLTDEREVGGLIDVKTRQLPGAGADLSIRPNDADERPYVLAISRRGLTIELVGWLCSHEAKARGEWNERARCWFAPPSYRPIEELIRVYRDARGPVVVELTIDGHDAEVNEVMS
jgi:hypothetical protein